MLLVFTALPLFLRTIPAKMRIAAWAAALGLVSGIACVAVRLLFRMLQWCLIRYAGLLPQAAASLSPVRRVMTPIIGAAFAVAVLWTIRRWKNPGSIREYADAVRHHHGVIPFAPTLWQTLSSAFSVATGAAIGREGSMIQFSSALISWLGRHSPIRFISLAQQVSYGAAAAVAAAYQAPIAGVFFAVEIVVGVVHWDEIPALACASASGWLVSRFTLGSGPLFPIHQVTAWSAEALWTIPLAALLGCASPAYQWILHRMHFFGRWPGALLWAGLVVGLLSLLRPAVWGNGDVGLHESLADNADLRSIASLLLLRLVATAVCVGAGTVGGVFTPTLFAGASLGLIAGQLLHVAQPTLLAVAGLSAFLSAVTHAPMMAGLMAVELTGCYELLPLLLVLNFIACFVAGRLSSRSIYVASVPPSCFGSYMLHRPSLEPGETRSAEPLETVAAS